MLRKRKNRRYNEEANDEDDCGRKYDIHEKIRSERFELIHDNHYQKLHGDQVTLKLIQRHGFERPILVDEPDGLELRVPPKKFLVRDIRNSVGHDRVIDVMDVKTQKNIEMSMEDWCKYYESKNRHKLLNVISLEFSHTQLDDQVDSPSIVKLLDWVDQVWPKFLKESQTESTNTIQKMKYPKVQKYCLMSVKGSYTDFHIDFGGTSVWYHILRGKKIFWMVPPTELNLQTYEEWTLSGMQQEVFFGDTVEECFRVELVAGNTFFIPSGWIHAVYTLEDSLVFGGNFLHSFGVENQLKVSKIEDSTKVPIKFRYPFYTEILWYTVQHYVHCLTGKDHLHQHTTSSTKSTPEKSTPKITSTSLIVADDESTESDQDESEANKEKVSANKRKKGKRAPAKQTKKAPRKAIEDDDDESTEIDSASEESNCKLTEKKSSNTCRMTKNSLLRLQYEIDDQSSVPPATSTKQPTKHKIPFSKSCSDRSSDESQTNQGTQNTTDSSLNLSAMMLSQDTAKLNGWSSSLTDKSQAVWSNTDVESKEPLKFHLTKFELNGLKVLVKHLGKLSGAKKNLPALIRNSRALLNDCKKLIAEHENDDPELAVTGKPITLDLLNPQKSDINQLIEQFFRPSDNTNDDTTPNQHSPRTFAKPDCPKQQNRLKFNHNPDERQSPQTSSDNAHTKSSIQKETKCLSPNKKLPTSTIVSTTAPTTAAAPPLRPKSPPTRPLSNNQYTSKTKDFGSNLVLPGSFADLIAATSTEKKVFDVNGSDVASALFGPPPTKQALSPSKASVPKERTNALSPGKIGATLKTHTPATVDHPKIVTGVTESHRTDSAQAPNSPEPPKVSPPKRIINPVFRPQNKEKLIFASAPYISPINSSEQTKSGGLYPWQSPAPTQASQTQSNQKVTHQDHQHFQQLNSPASVAPEPQLRHSTSPDSTKVLPDVKRESILQRHIQLDLSNHNLKSQSPAPEHDKSTTNKTSDIASNFLKQESVLVHPQANNSSTNSSLVQPDITTKSSNLDNTDTGAKQNSSADVNQRSVALGLTDTTSAAAPSEVSSAKKLNKPRGPPKKSKEARLVLESNPIAPATAVIPSTSVIKLATPPQGSSSSSSNLSSSSDPVVKNDHVIDADKPRKPRKPRQKKKKEEETASDQVGVASNGAGAFAQQILKQPMTCDFTVPPISSSAAGHPKIGPQQYLISRPLLFNAMPTLTSAHLHQQPRGPVPFFTTPVTSTMGFPNLHHGARIVWATRPPGTASPVATTSAAARLQSTAPTIPRPLGSIPRPQTDNAALLSLATTALSTASLPSSPALSQFGSVRAPESQHLMVSSAAGQPTLFAGQPFFNPFIQRMSMPQFATPAGVQRPQSGRLVFARLPNQSQPRYLITQPGLIPQRPQMSPLLAGQSAPTMVFAGFKPSGPEQSKGMKTKKVKTS